MEGRRGDRGDSKSLSVELVDTHQNPMYGAGAEKPKPES